MSAARKVVIEITSDTVCPWCYIGKKRLDKAIARAPSSLSFDIRFKPFQLDPTMSPYGVPKLQAYEQKFGADRVKDMIPRMKAVGEAEGIKFDYGGMIANTLDSHRLLTFAESQGKQLPVAAALFTAYFENQENIGDRETLISIASKCGLDADAVRTYIESDAGEKDVREQVAGARRKGISGVPFFRIDGKYEISGAQEPAVFEEVFAAIAGNSA
ncbi:hypothetical protein HDU86_003157 [Geranomyces michiganensis]|nr:hypothetical protein HDU86_003157 [Geranomyces michiganensis]